jgi:hypothetical protein
LVRGLGKPIRGRFLWSRPRPWQGRSPSIRAFLSRLENRSEMYGIRPIFRKNRVGNCIAHRRPRRPRGASRGYNFCTILQCDGASIFRTKAVLYIICRDTMQVHGVPGDPPSWIALVRSQDQAVLGGSMPDFLGAPLRQGRWIRRRRRARSRPIPGRFSWSRT